MAEVSITTEGLRGRVSIDGVDLSQLITSVDFTHDAGGLPRVSLSIAAIGRNELQVSEAGVTLNGAVLPLEVEVALYRFLVEKHGPVELQAAVIGDLRVTHDLRSR